MLRVSVTSGEEGERVLLTYDFDLNEVTRRQHHLGASARDRYRGRRSIGCCKKNILISRRDSTSVFRLRARESYIYIYIYGPRLFPFTPDETALLRAECRKE